MNAVAPVPLGHWTIETWPGTLSAALVGAVCVVAGVWLARGIAAADARVVRLLLGPSRVSELERTLEQFRQMAIIMAVGVVLDTVVVRSQLVPSLVALTGRVGMWPGHQRVPEPARPARERSKASA